MEVVALVVELVVGDLGGVPNAYRTGLELAPGRALLASPFMGKSGRPAVIEQWTRDFAVYLDRSEQAGRELRMELIARLARVGVTPQILGADIDLRRARGWTMEQIGTVLDALATGTHWSQSDPRARERAALARAMFDAMEESEPCTLVELAARIP